MMKAAETKVEIVQYLVMFLKIEYVQCHAPSHFTAHVFICMDRLV